MTQSEIIEELHDCQNPRPDMELELQRLRSCYLYASAADKRVVWAVLNKYAPLLTAEGLN